MTLYEYDLLMTGKELRDVDRSRELHMQAFLNRQIESADKKGKSTYGTFEQFFDYKKELDKVTHDRERSRDSQAFELLFKANQ